MEEDYVEYWIYPTDDTLEGEIVLAEIWKIVEDSVNKYLWHQQLFNLAIRNNKDGWCLHGKVSYGESVNDEWMVVALLKFITSKMSTISARVQDSDGEIILIEAADFIPKWAGEPDLADGRVFLHGGEVHLLAPTTHPGQVTPYPSGRPDPGGAGRFIARFPHLSRAPDEVQKCISSRLGKLPEDVRDNEHSTNVLLPPIVAACISRDKQAVCDMIIAMRDKDHLDLRRCRGMTRVRPDSRKMYRVTFPKCLYAMLSSFDVRPHRSSGWSVDEKNQPDLLGFKLSLGLEILASRYRDPGQHEGQHDDLAWTKFVKKLTDVGYFQGEMEGSRKYRDLQENARSFFQSSTEEAYHSRLDKVMASVKKFESSELEEPSGGWLPPPGTPDPEDWMEVTPESLDQMLAAKFGVAEGGKDKIPGELASFLNKMSDMAGIEENNEGLNFKADDLISSMKKLLGDNFGGLDDSVPGFDEDDLEDDHDEDSDEEDDIDDDADPVIVDYMSRLDAEVGKSVAGRSELPDLERPLEVNSSVLSNLLSSYSEELGFSGPASSILNTIKINPGAKK